ncbi:hypothetical protein DXG03_008604 [Asterophora parasitica]|uniref:NAD(P)-binding domain-containing protein n=1 Tax=Asterophora parasitica TaxID=117018 RepID=A0A9P7G6Z8_9AGAR|nr:hypothetical protein DXG03_008604 [Asterophora parasitica]
MAAKTNIFLTGATGYIGGSILVRFLDRQDFPSLNITALVRSPEKAQKLQGLGINAVTGSFEDLALVEKLASEADIVINAGLQRRHQGTGVVPKLIHTSGTAVLAEDAAGLYAYETIYDDSDPYQIEALPPTQVHRLIDLAVIAADKDEGYVKTYIILPSLIYGIATGKLVDLEVQNPYSILVPLLVAASLERGQGGVVGEGKNIWPNVHIDEIADLYLILYDSIHANKDIGHGREGIYFGESDEHTFYDLSKEISKALVEIGRGESEEPTTFTKEEIVKYFFIYDEMPIISRPSLLPNSNVDLELVNADK